MQKNLPGNRLGRWLAGVVLALLATLSAQAQLTGTKTIPGTYPTLAAAITDLNTQGVGAGGVTFSIAAGYTETFASPTAGAITATGTSANPIVFQKAGAGANPLITAGVGTTTTVDAIISLVGSDYVTIDGLDVTESTANTTTAQQMEFGYALFRPSATDGCQFNVIRNCVVTLNKTNAATIGISGAAGTATSGTAVAATATTGANSSNKVYGNVVTNALTGIYFNASSSTSIANYDQNNEIGVTAGNTIGNFGGSASAYGAGGNYQNGLKITGNTINSTLNYTSATASTPVAASTVTSTLRGIYTPNGTSSNLDITNNTITLASGATTSQLSGIENGMGGTATTNTVNITGNTLSNSTYATSTSANTYLLYTTSSPATLNITNNTLSANSFGGSATASATCYLIYNSGTPTTANISGNVVTNNTAAGTASLYLLQAGSPTTLTVSNNRLTGNSKAGGTTTSGTLYCLATGTAAVTAASNTISNNSVVTAGTSSSTIYGYYNGSSPTAETLTGNTITNLSISGSTTSTSSSLYGMYSNPISSTVKSWTQNTVGTLALSAGGTVYGIYTITGSTVDISRNKVYDLSAGTSSGQIYGIYLSSGTTVTVTNNLVGDLRAAASTNLLGVNGIYVSSPTTANLYYNTISLAATSTGATFGTSGIYSLTTAALDLRNNIVVNKSTAAGTGGYTVALRRSSGTSGTAPANLATTSNNNLYYAGTPSATNLIYLEGTTSATNAQPTLASYKAFVSGREANSVTEDAPFLSTTGTAATFLHINPATATQVESGGTPISGITTDFDGDARNATTPDIGADEGSFSPAVVITVTGTTYTQNNTPTATGQTNQQVTGVVIAATGQLAGPTLNSITFNVGSTSLSNISNAKLYSSGSSTFALATATLLATTGSIASPSFTLTLTTPLALASGNNYFFLTYDIPATATAGATVASTATAVNVSGTTLTPTLSGPAGSRLIIGPLSGTYYITGTVGSSPDPTKEFATLTAAAAAYNTRSLASAVTFVLRDATYSTAETFPITFNANSTASATNTLTIQPGVTSTVSGTNTTALLVLNGPSYVTVNGSLTSTGTTRDLTLSNAGSGAAVVQVVSGGTGAGATNIALRNLNILASALNSGIGIAAGGTTAGGSGADNDNLTIQNNSIQQAYVGIYVGGTAATSAGGTDGLSITGNVIGGATSGASNIGVTGLFVANAVAPTITGNTVQNVGLGAASAAALTIGVTFPTGVSSATFTGNTINGVTVSSGSYDALGLNLGTGFSGVVDRNRVLNVASNTSTYGGRGIDINTGSTTSNLRVSNNFVAGINGYGWSSLGSDAIAGIRVLGTTGGVGLYYNSVNLSGNYSVPNSSAYISAALYVAAGVTALDVRNNVLVNSLVNGTSASKAYSFYSAAAATALTPINYNDYFVSGTQGVLAYFGSADVTTLPALRTATTQDASSISADPLFASATDLHVSAVALDAAATPIASVTTDIDGDVRNTTTPDIGADEFTLLTNDLAAAALVAPATTSACYGTAEPVSVSIRNAGTGTINFATNAATITVVVTLPGGTTQTLTTTVSTGTLTSGATQTVTLPGTLNMSAVGTYSFAITATVVGDGNTANDLLTPAPTRTVAAPVAGTLAPAATSICVSGTAMLTLTGAANGSIQYQSSPDNVTFTDIAGATSAMYTTPVLTTTTYYRAQVRCNTGTATSNVSTITVSNPQVASTNTPVTICSGSTATLTASASAGSSVRFFGAATGGTALATAASYTTPALTANATYYAEAFTPNGSSENVGKVTSAQTDGGYSGTATGLVFTATKAVVLQSATVYNATATAGSVSVELRDNATGNLIATAGPFAVAAGSTTSLIPTVLPLSLAVPAAGTYRLVTASTPTPPTLYRDGSSNNAFPYTSPSGAISITSGYISGTSTSYYFFYNIAVSADCVNSTRTAIQVNVTQPATTSFPAATASTCGSTPYQLAGTVTGSATTGTYTSSGTGTFAPNATTLNATYTPSAADITAGSVTITLTSAAGTCPATTATLALSISRPAVATFSYPTATTYCAGSAGTVTPTLASGATAGTFSSTAGLTLNATTGVITLSTSTAGTYTVTNTVAASGACAAVMATATVTITPATSAAFSYPLSSYCVTGLANPAPNVTGTTGGTFSSSTGLALNATTGVISLGASTPGTYTVTYTVAGACGSSATTSVTISAGQVATFSYPAAGGCAGSTGTVAPTLASGATAGTFSSTTGLTLNATTGVITLSTSTTGTYTVTNTVAASGGCAAATATATITIGATPVANAGAAAAICSGSSAQLGVAATAGLTYSWSPATGLSSATISNPTVTLTNTTAAPTTTTYTLTVTNASGCSATSSVVVTVNPVPARPTLTPSYNGTQTTLTSSSATGNQYYFNGVAIPGATAQTYVVNGSAATYGSYTVVVTNSFGCSSQASVATTVTTTRQGIAGVSIELYPNPTPDGRVSLVVSGLRSATQLAVIDALGRVVRSEQLSATTGVVTHSLDLSRLASGVYLLRLSNADGVETRRLTRE